MDVIQAYYDGSVFVPLTPVKVKLNQSVIITILETMNTKTISNRYTELFGALSAESYSEIIEALKDTERVDINEWRCTRYDK
jgi:predicted DNA-binding antitoxin AbrB/MazE fold protein